MYTNFQYRPLATESTVRLLRLEESKIDGRIACKLRHTQQPTTANHDPDYDFDAMSYMWGDPTASREILLQYDDTAYDWTLFPIHQNLWQFLDNIWHRKMFDRWFWTDRICLKQDDDREIGLQIPRMADIYRDARQVIAWLGLSVSQGEQLLPIFRLVESHRTQQLTKRWRWWWFQRRSGSYFSRKTKRAVSAMFAAEYWRRIWTVQELVSAEHVLCFIGNMHPSLQLMEDMPMLVLPDDMVGLLFRAHFVVRDKACPSEGAGAPRADLWTLLRWITCDGDIKSTRPHDRVYGILGLAASLSDGTSPRENIKVDYDKPAWDVFLDAVLEADVDWTLCYPLMRLLVERDDDKTSGQPIFTLLTRYTESNRTSTRHRELAELALSISDALYLVISSSSALSRHLGKLNDTFSTRGYQRKAQQNAAMLGIALALKIGCSREQRALLSQDWKISRFPRVAANRPWRCAAHQFPIHRPTGPSRWPGHKDSGEWKKQDLDDYQAKKEEVEQSSARGVFHSVGLAGLVSPASPASPSGWKNPLEKRLCKCRDFQDLESSGPCDGSILSCNFPLANLRLELSTCNYQALQGHWYAQELEWQILPETGYVVSLVPVRKQLEAQWRDLHCPGGVILVSLHQSWGLIMEVAGRRTLT